MQNKRLFVTNRICPFAHRVWIVLQELKIPYQMKQVPLFANDPYLKQVYKKALGHQPDSNGKVPVLVEDDFILAESGTIVQYLVNQNHTVVPSLSNPRNMIKSKLFSKKFSPVINHFYAFKAWDKKTQQEKNKHLQKIEETMTQFNNQLKLPYALGEDFTTADIMLYPWFARWISIQTQFNLPINPKFNRIHEWKKNIEKRQSLKIATLDDMSYIKGYEGYFTSAGL